MRLVHNLYARPADENYKLFGLAAGQMRRHDFIHNGGWYNADGDKLGWGDLDGEDIARIAKGLQAGEAFYILRERASYWDCPAADKTRPGADYVQSAACVVIYPGKVVVLAKPTYPDDPHYRETEREQIISNWSMEIGRMHAEITCRFRDEGAE